MGMGHRNREKRPAEITFVSFSKNYSRGWIALVVMIGLISVLAAVVFVAFFVVWAMEGTPNWAILSAFVSLILGVSVAVWSLIQLSDLLERKEALRHEKAIAFLESYRNYGGAPMYHFFEMVSKTCAGFLDRGEEERGDFFQALLLSAATHLNVAPTSLDKKTREILGKIKEDPESLLGDDDEFAYAGWRLLDEMKILSNHYMATKFLIEENNIYRDEVKGCIDEMGQAVLQIDTTLKLLGNSGTICGREGND